MPRFVLTFFMNGQITVKLLLSFETYEASGIHQVPGKARIPPAAMATP
jgi:hypothetical protein